MVSPGLVALQITADFPQDLCSPALFVSRSSRFGPRSQPGQQGRVWGSAHGQVCGPYVWQSKAICDLSGWAL